MTGQSADGSAMAQVDGAAVRYRRRGGGRAVVLLHPLRMQVEYFDPVCNDLGDADAEPTGRRAPHSAKVHCCQHATP